ncbi:MAG TPA: BMP family ABC transporter substrate-binding protein [Polyangia bacterium]|jgi:simple sugar transport system substrate-binding protein
MITFPPFPISRRSVLFSVLALSLPAAVAPSIASAADPLTVGFIYVGPKTDYGYNQAQAQGAAVISKMPGIKIREEEMVPETVAVQKTMESMINLDGAKLLFPTSFGYFDPHILKLAGKYPNVTFLHCGGLYVEGKHPKNVGSYFGYIDEAQYVAGIVAGMSTKSNKLGFIAAKPIPQVLRNINSYTLGARSVNPKVTTTVIFTGDWSMPVKEAEATNSLIDQGIDVLSYHVDSPKVIAELAERRGAMVTGYHASQAALAPKGYLTGAEWNWGKVYTDYIKAIQANKPYPHLLRGGLKEGFVKVSPYGKTVSAEAKKKADAAKAKFMAGTMVIYKGPLKDNTGKEVIAAGTEQKQTDIALESMDYLVEGVVGKTH